MKRIRVVLLAILCAGLAARVAFGHWSPVDMILCFAAGVVVNELLLRSMGDGDEDID